MLPTPSSRRKRGGRAEQMQGFVVSEAIVEHIPELAPCLTKFTNFSIESEEDATRVIVSPAGDVCLP